MTTEQIVWIAFGAIVFGMMALDLGVFHRESHVVKIREALTWTVVWVTTALIFMVVVYFTRGATSSLEFLTGYLIEQSLSVDNLFVFLMIFSHFRVPPKYQHRVLFWGIIGVLVMRALFIGLGVVLIQKFHAVIYVFGALLVVSGIKMAMKKEDEEIDFEKNVVLKLVRRFFNVSNKYDNDRFFVRENGKLHATLLFVVLLIVETTDVIFAVDSVPAVLAVSHDPFIVYTSNVFAILGLRSLYFALAGMLNLFHFLNYGLCVILCFVGGKMLVSGFYHIPIAASLGVIVGILALSIAASLAWPQKKAEKESVEA